MFGPRFEDSEKLTPGDLGCVSSLKLGLIGFVFRASAEAFVFIILCYDRGYVHLCIQEIGFVLHKSSYCVLRIACSVSRIA